MPRKPDRTLQCPECLREHAEVRGKKWRCATGGYAAADGRILPLKAREPGMFWLNICGAEGTVMPDGSLAVLKGGLHPQTYRPEQPSLPTSEG